MISPVVQNADFYNKWKHASPLYLNIEKDGIALYSKFDLNEGRNLL